ncbi:MAG: NAD-dependent epimerase/dehydratase family protein [Bacteroidetes bacterium]|nr:NAD-dependent epimerase/dehydratase family protein [Bacteroidota bacterium]
MKEDTILVTGACGQIGSELVYELRKTYKNVIASDLRDATGELAAGGEFIRLDVLYKNGLMDCVKRFNIKQVYHLAAVLSATGEKNPEMAWRINMKGLRNVLDTCVEGGVKKLFFPSTIAVFGPSSPKTNTPQYTCMEPNTIYGISKLAGERWCDWYFQKRGLDVRSIRYPGLISYKTKAGGGTTDYAVDIFFEAVEKKQYECFLKEDTTLPMMYMPDAIRGTIAIMEAPAEKITVRSGYNFAGFSFAPKDVAAEIKKIIPDFKVTYQPDFRQPIAESWPQSIDDAVAQKDWGWKPEYTLASMTRDMLQNIEAMQHQEV